ASHGAWLPDPNEFTMRRYKPGLSLSQGIQPYLSAGGGATGTYIRAGASMAFADMLGDHQLRTSLQVGTKLADLIAQASYLNMRSRWNWAISGGHVPWLTGLGAQTTAHPDGTFTR